MKKQNIIILFEYSPERADGSRVILQNDIIGTFPAAGVAHLCYNALLEGAYKHLINYNAENDPNKSKYALMLQTTR